jgi:heparan-alpha-glucosaminide N-acetyltransferase
MVTTYLTSVDNCPKGYTGPGGVYLENYNEQNCTGGIARNIDLYIFG